MLSASKGKVPGPHWRAYSATRPPAGCCAPRPSRQKVLATPLPIRLKKTGENLNTDIYIATLLITKLVPIA